MEKENDEIITNTLRYLVFLECFMNNQKSSVTYDIPRIVLWFQFLNFILYLLLNGHRKRNIIFNLRITHFYEAENVIQHDLCINYTETLYKLETKELEIFKFTTILLLVSFIWW